MTSNSPAATAVSRFQDRIPASLYEVAWQYSLFDWYDAAQSEAIDWDLAPEHLAYLTPRAKSELFGADDSLVVVYADLSDPSNPQLRSADAGGPVEITTYTEADRFRIGHAYPEGKTSSMTDYSITTHKNADAHHIAGLRDDAWGTNNIQDRFTEWAQSDYAETVRNDASEDERTVLTALAALGDDEDEMDRLADAFLEQVESEDEEIDALITVKIRPPGADGWKFPGEIDVLNEVMRAKKSARLESISVEDASGEGTGYVTGDDETVTGGSPGLFGMYGKKQREHFPDIDHVGSSAWRARPIEFDTAAAIAAAGSLFDDFYRALGNNRRLYILPYLAGRRETITPETFTWFYEHIYKQLQSAETGSDGEFDNTIEDVFTEAFNTDAASEPTDDVEIPFEEETSEEWGLVRFAVVHQVTGNPDRVFFDTTDGVSPALALENAHNRVTRDARVFAPGGIFHNNPNPESSPLLGMTRGLVRYILYGGYFERTTEPTRSSRTAEETPGAGAIDDSQMRRVRSLLTDTKIDANALIEDYIHQLVQDQHDRFENDDGYIAFPRRSVVEQYVQLRALAACDALDTSNTFPVHTTPMPDTPDSRSSRLNDFIENHAVLAGDAETAVFLLGGLVGRITAHQSRENISSTLVRRYPVDYLTKQTIQEVTKEVIQMNHSYAEANENWTYQANSRYTSQLPDTMLTANPREWSLTEAELQWLYSLGITYGLNDFSLDTDEQPTTTEDTA